MRQLIIRDELSERIVIQKNGLKRANSAQVVCCSRARRTVRRKSDHPRWQHGKLPEGRRSEADAGHVHWIEKYVSAQGQSPEGFAPMFAQAPGLCLGQKRTSPPLHVAARIVVERCTTTERISRNLKWNSLCRFHVVRLRNRKCRTEPQSPQTIKGLRSITATVQMPTGIHYIFRLWNWGIRGA
jgi:hypothetical protein